MDLHIEQLTASHAAGTNAVASFGDSKKTISLWKDEPNVVAKFKFTHSPCLKVQMNSKQPLELFSLFLRDNLINTMVIEIN